MAQKTFKFFWDYNSGALIHFISKRLRVWIREDDDVWAVNGRYPNPVKRFVIFEVQRKLTDTGVHFHGNPPGLGLILVVKVALLVTVCFLLRS